MALPKPSSQPCSPYSPVLASHPCAGRAEPNSKLQSQPPPGTKKINSQSPPPIPIPSVLLDRSRLKPIKRTEGRVEPKTGGASEFAAIAQHSSPPAGHAPPSPMLLSAHPARPTEPDCLPLAEPTEHTQNQADAQPEMGSQQQHQDQDQDQVQPWQKLTSELADAASLERANSAAARQDSLARLNGQRSAGPTMPNGELDRLPPFLLANHLHQASRLNNQPVMPLPIPNNLGFSVGPNGRGVPRLSALQRKALEKIAANEQTQILTHLRAFAPPNSVTSLTRSHTTTGNESAQLNSSRPNPDPTNPDPNPAPTSPPDERQQARSNLIRKLSSRGPASASRLHTPPPANSPEPRSLPQSRLPVPPSCRQAKVRPRSDSLNSVPAHPPLWPEQPVPDNAPRPGAEPAQPASAPAPAPAPATATDPGPSAPGPSPAPAPVERMRKPSLANSSSTTTRASTVSDLSDFTLNSEFRSYRHSVERDRDSVLDRMGLLDNTLDNEITSTPTVTELGAHLSPPDTPAEPAPRPLCAEPPAPTPTPSPMPMACVSSHSTRPLPNRFSPNTLPPDSAPFTRTRLSSNSTSIHAQPANSPRRSHASSQAHSSGRPVCSSPATVYSVMAGPDERLDASPHFAPSPRSSVSVSSRLKARTSLSSRIDRSIRRSPSPSVLLDRPLLESQSKDDHTFGQGSHQSLPGGQHSEGGSSECPGSVTSANTHYSRPPNASRFRPLAGETAYQDRVSRALEQMNRGSTASSVSNLPHSGTDRPLRPSHAPPIAQAHSVVRRTSQSVAPKPDSGPSQFPPTPHLVRTHMPVASPADLARYNDRKLAPFPALLEGSPPSSPERPRSPRSPRSPPPRAHHGILSSATHFFQTAGRSRGGSVSSGVSVAQIGAPRALELPPSSFASRMGRASEEEELIDGTGWQSMGSAVGRIGAHRLGDGCLGSSVPRSRRDEILARLAPFLDAPPIEPSAPQRSLLSEPPRRLVWHRPVHQVVNATSVKDRYLFVFNDLLVIAKPLVEFGVLDGKRVPKLPLTLANAFLTKSVVEMKHLRCVASRVGTEEEQAPEKGGFAVDTEHQERYLMAKFVREFQKDGARAAQRLLGTSLARDEAELAGVLIKTLDLDKRQLGAYLCAPEQTGVLEAYLAQLKMGQMRIEDGLRLVLLSLRLPNDKEAVVPFIDAFGAAWATANERVGVSAALAGSWARGLIILSEHLHAGLHDSLRIVAGLLGFPNGVKTEAQFVESIMQSREFVRPGDEEAEQMQRPAQKVVIDKERLEAMLQKSYLSVRRDRLVQARGEADEMQQVEMYSADDEAAAESGARQPRRPGLPGRVTYQVASELVTVRIPAPDAHFGIKLFSLGLRFEPAVLSFHNSRTSTFRIFGRTLGPCLVTFVKVGAHAAGYGGLPVCANLVVERGFMRETVQVGFMNHLQARRKYLFSFGSRAEKDEFVDHVGRAQAEEGGRASRRGVAGVAALQVLRDTLIVNEELVQVQANPHVETTVVLKSSEGKKKPSTGAAATADKSSTMAGADKASSGAIKANHRVRSNSLSETYIYTSSGAKEAELQMAIVKRRQEAQAKHVKKKQQKLLQERLKGNIVAEGMDSLSPYSITKRDAAGVAGGQALGESGEQSVTGGKGGVEGVPVEILRFVRTGTELVKECEQNSLIPLVLGFLSVGLGVGPSATPVRNLVGSNNSSNQIMTPVGMSMNNNNKSGGGKSGTIVTHNNYHHFQSSK